MTDRTEERYEDCERCGERYGEEYIDGYLRDEEQADGELLRVCCPHDTNDTNDTNTFPEHKED